VPLEQAVAKLPQLKQAMIDHFKANHEHAGEGLELLPGVRQLLQALATRSDVAICLVTGNLEPIGALLPLQQRCPWAGQWSAALWSAAQLLALVSVSPCSMVENGRTGHPSSVHTAKLWWV
jgi:hypothetical protein